MFSANLKHHSKFTEMLSMEFILEAYGCIVLKEINAVLYMAFSFYHLGSCFLTAVPTSTEQWLLKHYQKKFKKKLKAFI